MSAWVEALKSLEGPGGVLVGITGTKLFERKKSKADALKVMSESIVLLLSPLNQRIDDLTGRVATLEAENTQTKSTLQLAIAHIGVLRAWIKEHLPGKTPPPAPSALGL